MTDLLTIQCTVKDAQGIVDEIKQDYLQTKVLPDGSIACLGDLLYTRAIYLGVDRWGFARRFCFADRALAESRFAELRSEDDCPDGFIARRGKV